jgi:hypothetical protein
VAPARTHSNASRNSPTWATRCSVGSPEGAKGRCPFTLGTAGPRQRADAEARLRRGPCVGLVLVGDCFAVAVELRVDRVRSAERGEEPVVVPWPEPGGFAVGQSRFELVESDLELAGVHSGCCVANLLARFIHTLVRVLVQGVWLGLLRINHASERTVQAPHFVVPGSHEFDEVLCPVANAYDERLPAAPGHNVTVARTGA